MRNHCYRKLLHLLYSYLPTALTDAVDDAVEVDIPNEIEDAVIFYAASLVYEDAGEIKLADRFRARYIIAKNEYKQQTSNQNPKYRAHRKGIIRRQYNVI